jgi:hypothetical protein
MNTYAVENLYASLNELKNELSLTNPSEDLITVVNEIESRIMVLDVAMDLHNL